MTSLGYITQGKRGRGLRVSGVVDSAEGKTIALYLVPVRGGERIRVSQSEGKPSGEDYLFILDLDDVPAGTYLLEALADPYDGTVVLSRTRHGQAYSLTITETIG